MNDLRYLSVGALTHLTKAIEIERREALLDLANNVRMAFHANKETYTNYVSQNERVFRIFRAPYRFSNDEDDVESFLSDHELRGFGVDIVQQEAVGDGRQK